MKGTIQDIIAQINEYNAGYYPDLNDEKIKHFHDYVNKELNMKDRYFIHLCPIFEEGVIVKFSLELAFDKYIQHEIHLQFINFLCTTFSNYLIPTPYILVQRYRVDFLPLRQIKNNIRKEKLKHVI